MSPAALSRLAGLVLLVSGLASAILQGFHPEEVTDPLDAPLHLALYPLTLAIMLSLGAVVARLGERGGLLGLFGYLGLVGFFGSVELAHSVLAATIMPALLAHPDTRPLVAGFESPILKALMQGPFGAMAAAAMPLLVLGALLFAAATWRAATLPRWPAALLLLGTALLVASAFVPGLPGFVAAGPFFLALAGYGSVLARGGAALPLGRPSRSLAGRRGSLLP